MSSASRDADWLASLGQRLEEFAQKHEYTYSKSRRHVSASFEIGCFLALATFYEREGSVSPQNLRDGEYRYLTTPAGVPENFSYLEVTIGTEAFHIRQQLRVRSHLHADIAFSPDIIVLPSTVMITEGKDRDYGQGRMRYCYVEADSVVAAHECKCLQPFPELFVSFIGALVTAHGWFNAADPLARIDRKGPHLAPTMFVGGSARALHNRMTEAMREVLPLNVIVGLHRGTWSLRGARNRLPAGVCGSGV